MNNENTPTITKLDLGQIEEITDSQMTVCNPNATPISEAVTRAIDYLAIPNRGISTDIHFEEETISYKHTREVMAWLHSYRTWQKYQEERMKPIPITLKIDGPSKSISIKKPKFKFSVRVTKETAENQSDTWLNWIEDDNNRFDLVQATTLPQLKQKAMKVAKIVDAEGVRKALNYHAQQWNEQTHFINRLIGFETSELITKFKIHVEGINIKINDFLHRERCLGRF